MKKTFFLLFLAAASASLAAQSLHLDHLHFPKKEKPPAQRGGDFYVVDSLYCYSHQPADQPVERQHNLSFSEAGEALESVRQRWLPWLGEWRNTKRSTYAYDAEGNLLEQTVQLWDTLAQVWTHDRRTLNAPNPGSGGGFLESLNQRWSDSFGGWRNTDRLLFGYDNGFIASFEQELWDTLAGVWKNNFKILYAVNPQGQVVSTLFQLWSEASGSFAPASRTFHSFDPDEPELETQVVTEIWDEVGEEWLKSSRTVKAHDSGGNLVELVSQLWNTPDSSWLNQSRTLQNFDAGGGVTLRTEQTWDGAQWVNFFQTNNVYDAAGNLAHFEVAQWQGSDWLKLSSCDFYWRFHHEVLAAAGQAAADCACVVPNPYPPGASIFCKNLPAGQPLRLALFDLSGKLVHAETVENQFFAKIAVPLPAGLYVLVVSGERGVFFRQKLVVAN